MKLFPIVLLVGLVALPLLAQDKPADNMEIVREAMQAEKKLFIAENMGLTESEAKKFWPVYEDYQKTLKGLVDRDIELIETYAENYDKMTDAIADKLIGDFMAIEQDAITAQQSFLPKFSGALPATKVARYFQLENKIKAVEEFDMAIQIPVVPIN